MNNRNIRIPAAITLLLLLVITIWESYRAHIWETRLTVMIWTILGLISLIMMIVSLLMENRMLLMIGSILGAASLIRPLFMMIKLMSSVSPTQISFITIWANFVERICMIVFHVLLLLSCKERRATFGLYCMAPIIGVLAMLALVIPKERYIPSVSASFLLYSLFFVLAGICLQSESKKTVATQGAGSVGAVQMGSADRIEALGKLKTLLDTGAITQAEFDEKKKQILGL